MSDYYYNKFKKYIDGVWDDCEKEWVHAIFYHPWQAPKYKEEEIKTEPLPGRITSPSTGHCTCGGKFAGGTHSDWCDINHKEEDEIPF